GRGGRGGSARAGGSAGAGRLSARRLSAGGGAAGAVYCAGDGGDQRVYLVLGGGVAEGEAQRAPAPRFVGAHGEQEVAGLGDARRAGGSGGAGDALRVEQHEQGVALAAGERDVRV